MVALRAVIKQTFLSTIALGVGMIGAGGDQHMDTYNCGDFLSVFKSIHLMM